MTKYPTSARFAVMLIRSRAAIILGFILNISNLEWLANAPRVEVVVISARGEPVLMPAPDPRAFMIHKVWLSKQHAREPVKKQRDYKQAVMVLDLLNEYLPQFPLDQSNMKYFPRHVIEAAISDLQKSTLKK